MARMDKQSKSPVPEAGKTSVLNFAEGSYLESTSRPLYALCFLLPLIVIYEAGTIFFNTRQYANTAVSDRVVTFVWLEELGRFLGFGNYLTWLFPGLLVLLILLCWHVASRNDWTIKVPRLFWMGLESFVLALPLFAVSAVLNRVGETAMQATGSTEAVSNNSYWADLTTSIGAGIYEELFFRLIVMGLLLVLLEDVFKLKSAGVTLIAVAISAGLFSAHHYIGFAGGKVTVLEEFQLGSFVFRTIAGVYFAMLFRYRGYGVTAGTHAAYNIMLHTYEFFL